MPGSAHKVADVDELPDASRVIVEVDGREIAVFRIDGDYYAIANYCVHQAGPLGEGELRGRMTRTDTEWRYDDAHPSAICPWHGWAFDVETGRNIQDDRYAVPTYDVEVRDGEVFVLV